MISNIQAMEIQPDLNDITTGTIKNVKLIHCVSEGDIVVAFDSGNETVTLVDGDDRSVPDVSITVSSGIFTFNR